MVAAYDITPIRRFQCLPGRPAPGLYKPCTAQAYQFTAKVKGTASPLFVFYTGYNVGNELLELLNAALPPLEKWEAWDGSPGGGVGGAGNEAGPTVHVFNASLLRLLNLFFLRYEFDPAKPSGRMFVDINRNPGVPQYHFASRLNTVLLRHGETAASLLAWITSEIGSARLRPYNFNTLRDYLASLPNPPDPIVI